MGYGQMFMDLGLMQQRRTEMFGAGFVVGTVSIVAHDGTVVGEQTVKDGTVIGEQAVMACPCHECGVPVIDQDAHFGWHLKLDNIDQRVEAHGHPFLNSPLS